MSGPEPPVVPLPHSLTIRLFGPLSVLVNGQPIPHLRSRKAQWLLALLTLRHGRPVQREWLAGTLWPDVDQTQAFANLRPALSELRKALGNEGTRLQSPNRNALLLDLTGADVDLLRFDAAIANGCPSALQQAVSLYRGPLLEGCTEDWTGQERSTRDQSCFRALQKLAGAAQTAGDYPVAAAYWRQAIILDPMAEEARRGQMAALAQTGDRNAALQAYRDFVALLRSDPNAVPDAKTTALYQQIRGDARKQAGTPGPLPGEKAAPTTTTISGYLPHALTDLVGREDERLAVAERLRRSRLVTLTGPGGIGKTRLALAVASEVAGEFTDGAWLVALDALADGKQTEDKIASVLGVKETVGKSLIESLTAFLQKKRLLLLLDNCEHLLPTIAPLASHLLRHSENIRILATSRSALGITGESVWVVPALAAPDIAHLPPGRAALVRVLSAYESVQLFVDRAQAIQKQFALTGDNALAVAHICAQLEGLPLALELAAARVATMAVSEIALRLDSHLGQMLLLTAGRRDAQPRQQTLRAALDWSYQLLSEGERVLLARLTVFRGGWSLPAAEAVGGGGEIKKEQVLDLLAGLVDKSLVLLEPQGYGAEGRYRLLEMVRQYAGEHLEESGEAETVKSRHRDWFLDLAETAAPHLRSAQQEAWLRRLESEHDNLRAALERSADETDNMGPPSAAPAGLRMAAALHRFWSIRGYLREGRHYLMQALAGAGAQSRTLTRAMALNGAGSLALDQGDYAASREVIEEGLGIFREKGDPAGIVSSLLNLGSLANLHGNFAESRMFFEESLGIAREQGDKRGIATALMYLGGIIRQQGEYAESQKLLEESLLLRRELEDPQGIATTLSNLGNVVRLQGKYDLARALLEESVAIRRELGEKKGLAWSLSALGSVALWLGDFGGAQALHEQSLQLRREVGNSVGIAWALTNLGTVAHQLGQMPEAYALYTESLTLFRSLENRGGTAAALVSLGRVLCACGDLESARSRAVEGFRLHRELKDTEAITEGLMIIAEIQRAEARLPNAVRLWGAAYGLRECIGMQMAPYEKEMYDRQVQEAVSVLGGDIFAAEWEAGVALTWEQATVYALGELGRS